MKSQVIDRRTDATTFFGALASRLRLHGHALHGLAAAEGGIATFEGQVKSEMAADMEAIADYLDLIRHRLCSSCRLLEVIERVSVTGGVGRAGRRARPPASRRGSP